MSIVADMMSLIIHVQAALVPTFRSPRCIAAAAGYVLAQIRVNDRFGRFWKPANAAASRVHHRVVA